MSALAANLAVASAILLTGLSMLLMAVGLVSYLRLRHSRLLWVTLGFLGMAAQGLYLSVLAYQDRAAIAAGDQAITTLAIVNLVIVFALYLAVVKR